jgi:hypothetical protein
VECCAQLSVSPERRNDLGSAGRRTAVTHLDMTKIARGFAELVMSIVPAVPGAPAR